MSDQTSADDWYCGRCGDSHDTENCPRDNSGYCDFCGQATGEKDSEGACPTCYEEEDN